MLLFLMQIQQQKKKSKKLLVGSNYRATKDQKNLWKQVIFCLYFKGIIVFRLFIFARKDWPDRQWQLNPYKKTISPFKQRQFFCEWRGKIVISTIIWIYVTVKIPGSEVFV